MILPLQCRAIALLLAAAILLSGCGGGATSSGIGTPGGGGGAILAANANLTNLTMACVDPDLPCDGFRLVTPDGSIPPEGFIAGATFEGTPLGDYSSTQSALVEAVTVTPTAFVGNATISINGTAVASGATSPAIELQDGENIIEIVVTATNGVNTRTYRLFIDRLSRDNTDLAALSLSIGTLTPAFERDITEYSASVANSVAGVSVTARPVEPAATIEVIGQTVTPVDEGMQSGLIDLVVGDNPPIEVKVTSLSGTNEAIYSITVSRLGSADLASVSIIGLAEDLPPGDNEVTLSLESAFRATTTAYDVMAENRIAEVIVSAAALEPEAVVVYEHVTPGGLEEFAPGTPVALKAFDEEDPESARNTIRIRVTHDASGGDDPLVRTYTLTVIRQPPPLYVPEAYVKPVDIGAAFAHGRGVALTADGDILAVGAPGALGGRGAVYLYAFDGNVWSPQLTLEGPDPEPCLADTPFTSCDAFGYSVALAGDGNTLAVGSPSLSVELDDQNAVIDHHGAVYLYTRENGIWVESPIHIPPFIAGFGYRFGHSVALAGSGVDVTLAVGSPGEASVSDEDVYQDPQPGDFLGGGEDRGAVFVYDCLFSGNPPCSPPRAMMKLTVLNTGNTPDRFGASVALSGNGDVLAAGAPGLNDMRGVVTAYKRETGVWGEPLDVTRTTPPRSIDEFGISVALSDDGELLAVGMPGQISNTTGIDPSPNLVPQANNSGAAYVFAFVVDEEDGEGWVQQVFIKPSNTRTNFRFGTSVALNGNGNFLLIGAPGENSLATTVDGNQHIAGAIGSGAGYQFRRVLGEWSQIAYIKVPNSRTSVQFGTSVALSGDGELIAGGAPGERSEQSGVIMGSDYPGDNDASGRGAAYLFRAIAPFVDPEPPADPEAP